MSGLLPIMVNAPLASKFGGPNPSLPVNGWPSLQVATIVATVVPKGVVLGSADQRTSSSQAFARARSEEDIDEIVCRFISKGGKSETVDAVSPDRRVRLSG